MNNENNNIQNQSNNTNLDQITSAELNQAPINNPSVELNQAPINNPSVELNQAPINNPSAELNQAPINNPSAELNQAPISNPSVELNQAPINNPSAELNQAPINNPSAELNQAPINNPSAELNQAPINNPNAELNQAPINNPSVELNQAPISNPSAELNQAPINNPSAELNQAPINNPSAELNQAPISNPSVELNQAPISNPSAELNQAPISNPSVELNQTPISNPSAELNQAPINNPSVELNQAPINNPSVELNQAPISNPSAELNQEQKPNNTVNAYDKQPVTVTQKKKGKSKIIILVTILLLIVIAGIIYWLNNSKAVFSKALDKIENNINSTITIQNIDKKMTDIKMNIDSNMKDYNNISKYTFGLKSGIDSTNKKFEGKAYLIDENGKEYSYTGYFKNSKLYSLFSTYEKLISIKEAETNDFDYLFKNAENINVEEAKHLYKTANSSLKRNLNNKKMSTKIEQITVNNKKIYAFKNTYICDTAEANRLEKAIINDIYKNKKDAATFEKMTGLTKDDFENNTNSQDTQKNSYNIYTNIFGKIIGFDYESNGKKQMYYYSNNKNFNIMLYDYIEIIGKNKNNKLQVTINIDKKEIAILNFDKLSKNNVSFDYKLAKAVSEEEISGNINYSKNSNNINLNIKNNIGKNYINIKLNSSTTDSSKIAEIDEKQAIEVSEEEFNKIFEDFMNKIPINETELPLI